MDEPIRLILRWMIAPLLVLLLFYVFANVVAVVLTVIGSSAENAAENLGIANTIVKALIDSLAGAAWEVWQFVKPLLQLGFVLLIVFSFVRALGIDMSLRPTTQELSIQTILAFLVVGGFALASLLNRDPAGSLKELALVVVGFYFGSKARDLDDRNGAGGRGRGAGPSPTAHPPEPPETAGAAHAAGTQPGPPPTAPPIRQFEPAPMGRGESEAETQARFERGSFQDAPDEGLTPKEGGRGRGAGPSPTYQPGGTAAAPETVGQQRVASPQPEPTTPPSYEKRNPCD
jgi:hypothetical protein